MTQYDVIVAPGELFGMPGHIRIGHAQPADRLETGICHINGPTVYDDPAMPFGGMKASGYGRFGGAAALEEFTELRWIAHHGEGQTYPL